MPKQLIIEETELTHTALVIVLYNVVTLYLTVQCCHALPHGVTCNHGSAGLAPVLWSALSYHSLSRRWLEMRNLNNFDHVYLKCLEIFNLYLGLPQYIWSASLQRCYEWVNQRFNRWNKSL